MNANLERKLPHLRQFFNIVFGFSVGVLILALPAPETFQWQIILTSMVLFLFLGALVIHAWWRQADMMSTTRLMKIDTWLILFLRLFLVYTLVYWVRTLATSGVSHFWGWTAIFMNATLLYGLSTVQQLIVLHPLYGKNRVMQRREVITDSLLTGISSLYVVGLILYSDFFMSWRGGMAALVALGVVRPIAKALTVWKELPPPHRGGRRAPESAAERVRRQQQRSNSSRSRQTSTAGSSSSRKVVSARNLRDDKNAQRSQRQQPRRDRRSQQQNRTGEKATVEARQAGAAKPTEKAAEKEKAATAEPAKQPAKPEMAAPTAKATRPEPAAAKAKHPQAEESRVEMTGTALPSTPEPAEPAPAPNKEEETPKAMYGRKPSKKTPDLEEFELNLEITYEDLEAMDAAIVGKQDIREDKDISYGRKPRRKQPELLEELHEEAEAEGSGAESGTSASAATGEAGSESRNEQAEVQAEASPDEQATTDPSKS
ncbi:MAG: hypothetical protein Q9P14_13900 [candidate division KSB1 bacterium]|nr:hypothetical protein [candidate division KSB1 bacterium]